MNQSDIHGFGIFATKPIEKGQILGLTHISAPELIRTPLGGYINHSLNPNCIRIPEGNRWYLQAIETIEKCCTVSNFRGLRRSRPRKVWLKSYQLVNEVDNLRACKQVFARRSQLVRSASSSAADLGATPSFHRLLSRPVALGDPLGTPWGLLGDPLGIPWGFLGTLGDSSGTPWGPLGDLRGRFGVPWARLGDPLGTTYQFFWRRPVGGLVLAFWKLRKCLRSNWLQYAKTLKFTARYCKNRGLGRLKPLKICLNFHNTWEKNIKIVSWTT